MSRSNLQADDRNSGVVDGLSFSVLYGSLRVFRAGFGRAGQCGSAGAALCGAGTISKSCGSCDD